MDSKIKDGCTARDQGFADHAPDGSVDPGQGIGPASACHPTNDDDKGLQDMPGNHHLLKALNDAPPLTSLISTERTQNEHKIQNIPVPSDGSRNLSSAQAMLDDSLDSGRSLMKGGTGSNRSTQFTCTEINNIPASQSDGSTISTDSNTTSYVASSYLQMAASTDLNNMDKRMRQVESIPLTNQVRYSNPAHASGDYLPNNINQSLSLNEDTNQTSVKQAVTKSTQTDQQSPYGAACASTGASAESMPSGPATSSASSLPSDEILVCKLKLPVVKWLKCKLETRVGKSWHDVADLHNWDYQRITDFEERCVNDRKSPFCSLLAEEEFQDYRLGDLKNDLLKLPRKDILRELDQEMARHYNG